MDLKAISLALATIALTACGSAELPPFTTTVTAKSASSVIPGVFAEGEAITFTLEITNNSGRAQHVVWCMGGPDLHVYDANGEVAWSLSDGGGFLGIGTDDSFAAGEVRSVDVVWHQDRNDLQPNYEFGTDPPVPIVGDEAVPSGAYYAMVDGCAFQGETYVESLSSAPVDFLIR